MKKHGWVFTLNNYKPEELPFVGEQNGSSNWDDMQWKNSKIVYVGYAVERGEKGTPHLQGLIVFHRPVGLKTLKALNSRAHWEEMRGTFDEARVYCEKEGKYHHMLFTISIKQVVANIKLDHAEAELAKEEEKSLKQLSISLKSLESKIDKLLITQVNLIEAIRSANRNQINLEAKVNLLSKKINL